MIGLINLKVLQSYQRKVFLHFSYSTDKHKYKGQYTLGLVRVIEQIQGVYLNRGRYLLVQDTY